MKKRARRPKSMEVEAQGTDPTGMPETALPPAQPIHDEPTESPTDPSHSIPDALPERSRKSGRDREASQRNVEELRRGCKSTKASKVKGLEMQVSRGLLMRSALPEELVTGLEGEVAQDTVYTVSLIRDCIINMIHDMEQDIELPLKKGADKVTARDGPWKWFTPSDLGFPLVDDNYCRPIHPLVETYVNDCLRDPGLLDDNEEAGYCCEDSPHGLREQMQDMISNWGQQAWVESMGSSQAEPTMRERYSVPHAARNPDIIQDRSLPNEDPTSMILDPPTLKPHGGAVRFLTEPGSLDSSWGDIQASTFQGVASLITRRGPYEVEGARWHLLSKIFSSAGKFKEDFEAEILAQEDLDKDKGYRSFSWQFLRQAQKVFGAETYCGDTALTAPPFFDNVFRGASQTWGTKKDGPLIVNWTSLKDVDKTQLKPQLASTGGWILLALAAGVKASQDPPVPGARKLLTTSGKAYRMVRWWKKGTDQLVAYDKDLVVWVSGSDVVQEEMVDALRTLLTSKSLKDQPVQNSVGHEDIYWAGTEAGLLRIPEFNGVIYSTDGSQSAEGMGAGFYRHDTGRGGCCKVGNSDEGESSNRSEHAAAALALENSLAADQHTDIVILTDSKCLLDSIQPWIGEGGNPMIHKFPDGDILRDIIELLRIRVARGLFTLFVKIRAHRGEFFNEMADRWADQGALATENVRWNCPRLRPIFSWKVGAKLHRGIMSKGVKARANLMIAKLELRKHNGTTATFLKLEGQGRELLGLHWGDKDAGMKAKRRLLQCVSLQFPCAATFKRWGMRDSDECRLCKRLYPDRAAHAESLGHIQCYCPALQRPRIAVHHGIWRELHADISKWSTEKDKSDEPKWSFPSAISESDHCEWSFRRIIEHIGLFTEWSDQVARKAFKQEIVDFHLRRELWEHNEENEYGDLVTKFLACRPDGIGFNVEDRDCRLLEFTRPMDAQQSTPEVPEDWAEKKDIAKDSRYENHRSFIEEYSSRKQGSLRWKCTQANFTVGVRGSIKTEDFNKRLEGLGIQGKKIRDEITTRTVRKTLEISDAMLTTFFLAVNTNPEWAKHAVSKVLANTSTERYHLFKKFTGPTSGFDI